MEENALVRFTGDASDLAATLSQLVQAVGGLSEAFVQLAEEATASLDSISENLTAFTENVQAVTTEIAGVGDATVEMAGQVTGAFATITTAAQEAAGATKQVATAAAAAATANDEAAAAATATAEAASGQAEMFAQLDAALAGNIPLVSYAANGQETFRTALEDTMPAEAQQAQNLNLLQQGYAATGEGLDEAGNKARVTGYQMMLLAGIMEQVAQRFLDLGVKAQDNLSVVASLTGTSAAQMQSYTSELIALAEQMGMPLAEAAQGLYYVVSAGYAGAQAFPVLTVAMQDAVSSGTDFKQVTDALTSAMRAYGAGADQATHYSDMMIEAVVYGKQTFEEFSHDIGIAAETGKNAGFSFAQVAAAESTLTEFGFPAANAMRDLDVVMRTIGGSSAPVVEATIKKAGVAFDFAKFYSSGLYDRLQMLYQALGSDHTAFQKATGGAWGYQAAISIVSDKTGTYQKILNALNNQSGQTAQAFATSEQRLSAGAQHLGAGLSVLAYQFVTLITPALRPFLEGLGQAFSALATAVQQHNAIVVPILLGLAAVIAGTVVAAIVALIAMFGEFIGPAMLVVAAVGLVVQSIARFVMAVQAAINSHKDLQQKVHELWVALQPLIHVLGDTLGAVLRLAGNLMQWLGQQIVNHIASALEFILPVAIRFATWLSHVAVVAQANFMPTMRAIGAVIGHIAGAIGGFVGGIAGALGGAFHAVAGVVGGAAGAFGNFLGVIGRVVGFLRTGVIYDFHLLQQALHWVWQAVQPVVHAIQDALQPVSQALGDVFQHNLKPAMGGVQDILHNIGGLFGSLGEIIGRLISLTPIVFIFQHFKDILGALGVVVQGVIGTFHFIANILGVILPPAIRGVQLVFGLMLAGVQAVGGFLATVFGPALHFIANILGVLLAPALQAVGMIIHGLLNIALHNLQMALQAAGNVLGVLFHGALLLGAGVLGVFVGALLGVLHMLGQVLAGIIRFVGGGIQFFIGWVQFIVAIVSGFVRIFADILTGHFNRIGKDLQGIWKSIASAVTNIIHGFLGMAQGLFQATFGAVIGLAKGFLGGFLGVFGNLYHTITGQTLPTLINGIKNAFINLPADLLKVGADIIQHLINGILSKLGDLGKAVGSVAQKIRDFFPHSPPKEGPLMDLEAYGPTLVHMVARGITANVSVLHEAAKQAATAAHAGLTGAGTARAGGGTALGALGSQSSAQTALLAGILGHLQQQSANAAANSPTPAGYAPTDSRPPMGITQQFGSVNFYGVAQLQAAYQALTRMAGQAQENAQRGAVAGLPFS